MVKMGINDNSKIGFRRLVAPSIFKGLNIIEYGGSIMGVRKIWKLIFVLRGFANVCIHSTGHIHCHQHLVYIFKQFQRFNTIFGDSETH